MRVRWKLVGLAGVAGVAATGAVLVRKHRTQSQYDPAELRARLHTRLSEVRRDGDDRGPPPEEPEASASDDIPGLM